MPNPESFSFMKPSLKDVNSKMLAHRMLLDRYSKVDALPSPGVNIMIDDKYYKLVDRMPELEGYRIRKPASTENFTYLIKKPFGVSRTN
jgi:hypothetical protein